MSYSRPDSCQGLVVTVEHGGNRVPRRLAHHFRAAGEALAGHRGWDPGTASLGRYLARRLDAQLITARVSRLVVDLNRSLTNPAVWSEFSRLLPPVDRTALAAFHRSHWTRVVRAIESTRTRGGLTVHLGVHSFTPELRGVVRNADVAWLYDPSRELEKSLAHSWRTMVARLMPGLRCRMNYPYRGRADGLVTALRKRFPAERYLGLELEVNQGAIQRPPQLRAIQEVLALGLTRALNVSLGPSS